MNIQDKKCVKNNTNNSRNYKNTRREKSASRTFQILSLSGALITKSYYNQKPRFMFISTGQHFNEFDARAGTTS